MNDGRVLGQSAVSNIHPLSANSCGCMPQKIGEKATSLPINVISTDNSTSAVPFFVKILFHSINLTLTQ